MAILYLAFLTNSIRHLVCVMQYLLQGITLSPFGQTLYPQIIIALIVKSILNNGGQIIGRITMMQRRQMGQLLTNGIG
jgi:hypothetical protein